MCSFDSLKTNTQQGCRTRIKTMKWPAKIEGVHIIGALKWAIKLSNFHSSVLYANYDFFGIVISSDREQLKQIIGCS